ncbi:MAG: L,D-transpeptidase [Proteobacteria bacterium]|nr:L,D-transpeptidase [Pseudomonadota bacterium]
MKRFAWLKLAVAAVAAAGLLSTMAPPEAAAQGLFPGLFGGGGGGRGGGMQTGRREIGFSPKYGRGTIIVSFADRRLYYVHKKGGAMGYPIGVPTGRATWAGTLRVSRKAVNPGWTPTARMRRENPKLPGHVKGGDRRNPLGVRALYLGATLYRIHGTDAPWTIGQVVTSGCIRLYNNDVIDLYKRVRIGTKVIVTNRRVAS